MGLIYTKDSDIRPQDLTLDFYLEATPLRTPKEKVNMTGIGTYKIGPYLDSLGYGITSVEIDVKPNLQPVISITFKDLYGNLIFNRDKKFGYDVLFQLPYPKFRLYVKGYLGKPVSFLLQVKSVKTNYQPSDGSYELKAEFVPNVFGFFNDIPYQFLFTVSGLKKLMDGDKSSTSIVDIAVNGSIIQTKIQQAEDKYSSVRSKLNDFNQNASGIYNSYKDNKLNFDGIAGDEDLIANGFKAIKFNLDVNGSNGKPFIPTDQTVFDFYGDAIIASINSPNKIEFKKDVKEISNFLQSNEGKKQIEDGKKIIKDNLDAITKSAGKKVFTTEEAKIDSQSIYNVMTRLAGDCAYVLGYILEGGISGFNGEPNRPDNDKIFGNYYPLIENENISNGASMGEQVPYPEAKKEIEYVERFVQALYEGIQYVEQKVEEMQPKEPEVETPDPGFETPLNKKLGNVETFQSSPYSPKADNIIVNIIQRSGLLGSGYGGSFANSTGNTSIQAYVDAEIENLRESVNQLKGTEKETLKKFCNVMNEGFYRNGTLKIKWDDKISAGPTLRQYLAGYFSKFPNASSEPKQFLNEKTTSLASLYTYHNKVLYHSPKNLVDAIKKAAGNNGAANNLLTNSNPELLCYFSAGDGPIPDDNAFKKTTSLINSDNSTTFDVSTAEGVPVNDKIYNYYQWFKATAFTSDDVQKTVFIDYTKLLGTLNGNVYNSTYFNPDQMVVKHSKSGTAGAKPQKEDVIFRLLDWKSCKTPLSYVINMNNQLTASYLVNICNYLLDKNKTYLSLTDAEIKKQKAAEAKLNAATGSGGGTPEIVVEDTGPKPYTRDEQQIRAIYTQFHHICQAWISLSNIENPTEDSLPSTTNVNLRLPLEKAYRNTDPSSNFYLNFAFPLVSEYDPKIDIRNAIINSDALLENNSQTSTLNMMQNICQVNNFLLQPIPGGLTSDLNELFKPRPQLEYAVGQNALSIIWAPTPENRFTKNNNEPVYPINGFLDKLNSIREPIMVLKYGDPNNIVVKSIKAGTDDNKVTSESLIATDAIVNNQSQNKKKGFDCSMLAVMQGRSYKISLDLMGNAQIFPTMYLAVDGLPIFTGLYWVTEVVHKLTPNNMETTVDAIKMKYNGDGKFAAVLPILKRTESSFVTSSSNSSYTNAFGSDLCMEFITKIKDQKFKNTTEINAFVKKYSNDKYNDFPTFFNKEVKGQTQFAESEVDPSNWTKAWDAIIPIVWADYGTAGINMLEFIALHAIIYNEVGGKYESIREYMDENKAGAPHPGIAKAFDKTEKKTSYNSGEGPKGTQKDLNKTAFELFNDVNYISAHGSLKFGNDPNVLKTTNQAWKGSEFPKSLFANNLLDATATGPSTFINEADFYKFSGRGFIQNTWRVSYKKIVGFILTYTGNDTIIKKYRDTWKGQGFNSDEEIILTKSTNANWDELFTSYELCGYAIKLHASDSKYQYITDLSKSKEDLIKAINKVADRISGSKDDYRQKHQARVFSIINKMLPSCAQTIQDINTTLQDTKINLDNTPVGALIDGPTLKDKKGNVLTHKCTVVKRGNTTVAVHTGNEPQFSKREVRSITLHITDGWGYSGCAARCVDGVGNCDPPVFKNGKQVSGVRFTTGGIHYAVDWTGARAAGIPELVQSVHGNNWNTHGIGIEICHLFGVKSKGPAGPQQVVTYSNGCIAPVGKATHGGTPNPGYVTLDYKYCGYDEFMEFTDVQITAVYNLCVELLGRYPKIKDAIKGKSPYTVWGWNGKPATGSSVIATRLDTSQYGIFGHCTSPGASHVDPPPTPKMIAMLRKLGMTG